MLTVLDLFSGIGGFSLGLERAGGFRTAAFCEIDPYCRAVLAKHWPDVPIHGDIRTLDASTIAAYAAEGRRDTPRQGLGTSAGDGAADRPERSRSVDLICGGFPCQPFSAAGKRRGTEDDRHLWPEMARVISEVRPSWVIGENVTGLIGLALDGVLSDLEGMGYAVWPVVLPACAVDAPHRRDRIWIVAHASGERRQQDARGAHGDEAPHERRAEEHDHIAPGGGETVAHAEGTGQPRRGRKEQAGRTIAERSWWLPEPDVGRVAHGIPNRVDRLRALGNSVVPQIPEIIGRAIMQAEGLTP